MLKRLILIVVIAIMMPAVLSACAGNTKDPSGGGSSGPSGNSGADVAARNTVSAPSSYVTDEMYTNALRFANVNLTRLKAVMKRAEAGEPVTVAVIGGSITQGSSASKPENSYASIMKSWWEKTFPQTQINFVNAGLGGTDSYLGVHRMDTDLLAFKPDFVIVEFSVNDEDLNFYKATYENLVRRILLQENNPAVLLLYMTQDNGTSAQANHLYTGFNYKLPQISYHDMIMKQIDAENIKWTDISPDNIHPNDKGHAICGELIWKYLNSVYAALDEPSEPDVIAKTQPLTTDAYMNAHILDNRMLTADKAEGFVAESVTWQGFKNGWQAKSGGSITFTVTAKRIGILFYRSVSGTYGAAGITIDGKSVTTLDGDFSGGWGNCVYAKQVFSDKASAEHTITITVPEGKSFDVLGILVAE